MSLSIYDPVHQETNSQVFEIKEKEGSNSFTIGGLEGENLQQNQEYAGFSGEINNFVLLFKISGGNMIKVENVTKYYGDFKAIEDVSFEVEKGDIIGFLGPNGAGKTTTMRIITGYFLPTQGKVYIDGIDLEEEPRKAKKLIGYLPENPPLYPEMKVEDYLVHVAKLKGMNKKEIPESLEFVISKIGLEEKRFKPIKTLSKGYKQRVGIAGAMIHRPKVLILDEPTIGLDPLQIIEIRNLIKEIGKDTTIILSSHILAEVQEVCDKILIINKGKIIAKDSKENLKNKLLDGYRFYIKINETDNNLEEILYKIGGVSKITKESANEFVVLTEKRENIQSEISKAIINNNYSLMEIKEEDMSLEEIFSTLIKEEE